MAILEANVEGGERMNKKFILISPHNRRIPNI
jgi:hypothetical protein